MNTFRKTRTGNFSIGLRRGWSEWQKDLESFIEWNAAHRIGVIDVGADAEAVAAVVKAGLQVGSADLGGYHDWQALFSPDVAKRAEGVAKVSTHIEAATQAGAKLFFAVLIPENPALSRDENMGYAIESLQALGPALAAGGAKIVIEGWPGPGALACTPEGYRIVLEATGSAIGINYDPSHLVRMGIDPVRFLGEFADRIYHVHGKDTLVDAEALYQYGTEQPATRAKNPAFGGAFWRYTIPGHGQVPWTTLLAKLEATGYRGAISMELEDANFNGTQAGEQAGILAGAQYLESV